jgi:glutaredoxin
MVILYSTGCPKCNVLKRKLNEANIEYSEETDMEKIEKVCEMANTDMLPILAVNEDVHENELFAISYMDFSAAIKWVGENRNDN